MSGEGPSILLFTFQNSSARPCAMAHFLFCNSLQPSSTQPNDVFWTQCGNTAPFYGIFQNPHRLPATCLETSRGGAEFSKPYSEEEHQERGITLGLHYVIKQTLVASQAQWIAYWTHTFWPQQEEILVRDPLSVSEDRLAALERVSGREEGRSASMLFV